MLRSAALLAVVLAVACGGNSNNHTDAAHSDADIDLDAVPIDGPPSNTVTLTTFDTPDFIAYRTGDGPWQTATANADGSYTLTVSEDYLVLTVCDNAGSGSAFDAEESGFTFSGDGAQVFGGCFQPFSEVAAQGSNVTITGTMVQAGGVQIDGTSDTSATPAWSYSIQAPVGVHDVLAIDTANKAVFDHAIDFEGSAAVGPTINTGSGAALIIQSLTVDNLGPGEQVDVDSAVFSTDFDELSSGSAEVWVGLPLSELGSNDQELFELFALDATAEQDALVFSTGPASPPAVVDLVPPFADATFKIASNGAAGSWTTLPTSMFDEVSFLVDDSSGGEQQIAGSPSYLQARSLTTLEFDASAPGYLAAWKIDPTMGAVALEISTFDTTTSLEYETLAFPASPLRAHRRGAAHRSRHVSGASRRIVP